MNVFSNIRESKHFSSDINDAVMLCAQRINQMKHWKVDELSQEEGCIVCLFTGVLNMESIATKENTYSITLMFNQSASGTDCVASINNPMLATNPLAKVLAKKMLKEFMIKL